MYYYLQTEYVLKKREKIINVSEYEDDGAYFQVLAFVSRARPRGTLCACSWCLAESHDCPENPPQPARYATVITTHPATSVGTRSAKWKWEGLV